VHTPAGSAQEYVTGKRSARFAFTLLFLLYLFDYVDRMIVVSLFPQLKAEWGLSDAQCGMLVSAVYWSILVFSFPVSLLVDRWSRRKGIALMAIFWSAATGAAAFTRSFGQLFAVKSAIGIGEAGYAPGGTAMMATLFPESKRAKVMGLWNASIPLGSALGIMLGGLIAERFGWRHAFGLVALPGALVALLFFFVKDYKTIPLGGASSPATEAHAASPGAPSRPSAREIARRVADTPSLWLTYLGFAASTFVTTSLIAWLPTWFHRTEGLPMDRASVKGGSVMLMAILGAPLGGWLADRWRERNLAARPLFAAGATAVPALVLGVAFGMLEGPAQYGALMVAGVTAVGFRPAAAAVTQDVVHPGLRATSYALCVIVQNLLGSSLGPLAVGALSDRFGLHAALLTLPLSLALAALLFGLAARWYTADLARVERVALEAEDA